MDPVKRTSLADQVFNRIKQYISNNGMQVGDKMPPESYFCKTLDVSRSTVREALNMLKTLGFINIFAGKGAFINNLSGNTNNSPVLWFIENDVKLNEVMETRMAIEPHSIKLAIRNASEKQFGQLSIINEQFEEALKNKDIDSLVEHDLKFHQTIIELANNQIFSLVYKQILEAVLKIFYEKVFQVKDVPKMVFITHNELIKSMKSRDEETAVRIIKDHLQSSIDNIMHIEEFAWQKNKEPR